MSGSKTGRVTAWGKNSSSVVASYSFKTPAAIEAIYPENDKIGPNGMSIDAQVNAHDPNPGSSGFQIDLYYFKSSYNSSDAAFTALNSAGYSFATLSSSYGKWYT